MAKITIAKKDGSASPFFWSDTDGTSPKAKTVYKKTTDGVKRMRGVRFNSVNNRLRRRPAD